MRSDSPDRDDPLGVHRALNDLPAPRAPRTLLPRVMAAVAALEDERGRAPANVRTWFTWSLPSQAASVVALAALVIGVAWIWPSARDMAGPPLSGALGALWLRAAPVVNGASAAISLTSIVWEAFFQPIVHYLLAWIVVMTAACAAFGAAIGRVALGGASHS